jgi:hypothetical protein
MNNAQNGLDARKIAGFLETTALVLLGFHFYIICYGIIPHAGVFAVVADRFYEVLGRTQILADESLVKCAVLLISLPISFFVVRSADRKVGWRWPLAFLVIGLALFFGADLLIPVADDKTLAWSYIVVTVVGYVLISGSTARLARAMKYSFGLKRFQSDTNGFKQEERLITTPYSLNFPAKYLHNGRNRKSNINIINPRRGVLIMGSPGSGKSLFVIEPIIEQLIRKGMAMFVFDFKYPTLSNFTYRCFLQNIDKYPASTRFCSINFTDLSCTHRCNLIDPATLQHKSDALGISKTIMLSINKSWTHKEGEFFMESSINFLAALIWFLKQYKQGIYCTLPHVIELSKAPYDEVFTILNAEPSTRGLVVAFKEAFLNKTTEMLDGQIASARIPLARLDSPDFYYVLSGNDLTLEINDPVAPVVLCLGGDSTRQDALAPVLSLYIDRLNRLINRPDRRPTGVVIDEFATVRATSVLNIIATGRSNNIVPILAVQDLSQLKSKYSHDEAEQIMNTAGNLICGQVMGETAKWVSDRFAANMQLKTTISVNSSDESISKTEQSVDAVTPATLANLSSGEFVGLIADDPKQKIELKGFHASFTKTPSGSQKQQALPMVQEVTKKTIEDNFNVICEAVAVLIKDEMKRILSDPALRQYVVKR